MVTVRVATLVVFASGTVDEGALLMGAGSSVQLSLSCAGVVPRVGVVPVWGGGGVEPGSGAGWWGVSDTLLGPEGSGRARSPCGGCGVGWLLVASFVLSVPCASVCGVVWVGGWWVWCLFVE